MVQYAHYHRDRRNIVTHLVGIPLIVLSIGMLLSLVSFGIAGHTVTLAGLLWILSTPWYLTRKIRRSFAAGATGLNAIYDAAWFPGLAVFRLDHSV